MAEKNVSLQTVFKKLRALEKRVAKVEKRAVANIGNRYISPIPEVELSAKEMKEIKKIRNEIKKGKFVSEKELFAMLSK